MFNKDVMTMIKTGFKALDEIYNISKPELIFLTGEHMHYVATLSGDIANNICLKQDKNALEIVSTFKEYLIKRLVVNNADVNYYKWTLKNEYEDKKYSDEELKHIGLATINLIETTRRLPIIIERNLLGDSLKNMERFILNYGNSYADRDQVDTLIILDVHTFTFERWNKSGYKYNYFKKKGIEKFIKNIRKISHKLNCPIMILFSNNDVFDSNKKYADVVMDLNFSRGKEEIFELNITEGNETKSCKLKYNYEVRKFEDSEV